MCHMASVTTTQTRSCAVKTVKDKTRVMSLAVCQKLCLRKHEAFGQGAVVCPPSLCELCRNCVEKDEDGKEHGKN